MGERSRGCLKGCAIGCAAVVVLGLVITVGCPYLMTRSFRQAVDAREQLEERLAARGAYVPAVNGTISAARIEAFLVVREQLAEACEGLEGAFSQIDSMERFEDDEEVAKSEVMGEAFKTVRSAMGIAPLMGRLFATRNQALLETEMGLDEYGYLYVLAYHDQLVAGGGELSHHLGDSPMNYRVHRELVELLERQLEAQRAAGLDQERIAVLEDEIAAMENDTDRLPWQDGLPQPIADSLTPYRERLDASFCPVLIGIDLAINESRGISIETR